ncbi:MAG: hypothetical protein RMY34_18200, partial [Aulosira sp. DedQUE10]|nr:hypothetical protein [Aulosira sp. DedQUE10]
VLIGVNLSSNAYPTGVLPYPLIPSPPAGRGRFGFRQNWGGVTRILMVRDTNLKKECDRWVGA